MEHDRDIAVSAAELAPDRLLDGRLKVRQLVIAVAIAEQGSIIRAAEGLHLTQPGVTRALRELETLLGTSLFERGPRGVTTTLQGEAFIAHARSILGQLRQAALHLDELSGAQVGRLRVGTHLSGTDLLLPRAVRRFKGCRPRVVIHLVEAMPEKLLSMLLCGELDVVVGRVDLGPREPGVRHLRLYNEPVRLVVRAGHPAATHSPDGAQGALRLASLLRYPWIMPSRTTRVGRELFSAFADNELELPEDRIESTSLSIPKTLILESDAVAVLPVHMALGDDQLRVLDCADLAVDRAVGALVPAERPVTPATAALIQCLRQEAEAIRSLAADRGARTTSE